MRMRIHTKKETLPTNETQHTLILSRLSFLFVGGFKYTNARTHTHAQHDVFWFYCLQEVLSPPPLTRTLPPCVFSGLRFPLLLLFGGAPARPRRPLTQTNQKNPCASFLLSALSALLSLSALSALSLLSLLSEALRESLCSLCKFGRRGAARRRKRLG